MEAEVRTPDSDGELLAECSDEEEYSKLGTQVDHYWSPYPEAVISLYEKISQNTVLEFNWKCTSGRRNPDDESMTYAVSSQQSLPKSKETEPQATDYDFEEESTPQLSRFGKANPTPKGGGKKKTTSLAGILSNMEKHRILDQKTKVLSRFPGPASQKPPTTTATITPPTTASTLP